eukprot:jgi/Botrbrau1/6667/Bobra.0202s0015.1
MSIEVAFPSPDVNSDPTMLQNEFRGNTPSDISIFDKNSEKRFSAFLVQTHLKSRETRFVISALMAGAYLLRSSSKTWQAAAVLLITRLTILLCFLWVFLGRLWPSFANNKRRRFETFLTFAITASMLSLPPLSLGNINVSENWKAGALVTLQTSRFLHGMFQMGSCTLHGFLFDLKLLTGIVFLTLQWNRGDCQLLCRGPTSLRPHFLSLQNALLPWLGPKYLPNHPVDMCVLIRATIQIIIGFAIPVVLGYRRDLRDRKIFAQKYHVPFPAITWKIFFYHLLFACGLCVAVIGMLSQLFLAFPEMEEVPRILEGGLSHTKAGPSFANNGTREISCDKVGNCGPAWVTY